jgi:hypothetical protein
MDGVLHNEQKRLKLGGGHVYDLKCLRLSWQREMLLVGHKLLYRARTDRSLMYCVCTRFCTFNT